MVQLKEDEEEYPPGPPKPYQFGYKIDDQETYSNYQRHETSDGEVVTGSYRVALPDGRTQTVTYKAGGTGGIYETKDFSNLTVSDFIRVKR